MNTIGWPVVDGVLILIAWAVLCAAGRFLGRLLVHLRSSFLSNGGDSDRIRRELDAILHDYSNFEKLMFAAGLFINMKSLQDEADERDISDRVSRVLRGASFYVHPSFVRAIPWL